MCVCRYQGNLAWAVGLQGDIPEGYAAVASDPEIPVGQGAGLEGERKPCSLNPPGGSLKSTDIWTHDHHECVCVSDWNLSHPEQVVGGACSRGGRVSWRPTGSC